MADDNAILPDQDLLDEKPHDPLPLPDVEAAGRSAQLCQECRESLCEA
jgi:hypothetical protein